jgi:signal transduction histidine kinase
MPTNLARRRTLATLSLLPGLVASALSTVTLRAHGNEARGTRAEAKQMADAALAHIAAAGMPKALADFANDKSKWVQKDLYVVVFDYDGKCLAPGVNDKLIGKNLLDLKDQRGRTFVRDFIASAKATPEGWVDLDWAHPQTKKPEPKTMNTRRVPGADAVLVVGFYR